MASPRLLDRDWVRKSFLVSAQDLGPIEVRNRFFSSASLKYVDTSPGANIFINPPPQFTRLADIKPKSFRKPIGPPISDYGLVGSNGSFGVTLGRYYSEALDDNAHVVHFRMGKTAYNSMLNYLTSYYSYHAGVLAKTGRAPGMFYTLGRATGMVVAVPLIIFVGLNFIGKAIKFAMSIPSTKYSYLKPTMPIYWAAVQNMVNHVANYMGLVTVGGNEEQQGGSLTADPNEVVNFTYKMRADIRATAHKMYPDIFDESGAINVYSMATKGQRLANLFRERLQKAIDSREDENINSHLLELYATAYAVKPDARGFDGGFKGYLDAWIADGNNMWGAFKAVGSFFTAELRTDLSKQGDSNNGGITEFMASELRDGSAFVAFRVEEGGAIGESFSNSAAESTIKGKLDGVASTMRTLSDSIAGGNMIGGALGSMTGGIVDGIMDYIGGNLDSLGLGGLAGLTGMGGGYADIPQHWESSMVQLPRASYTMKFISPYENPIAKLVYELIPTCMCVTMAMPHSTGPQSYSSPFMLEFYDKGRVQSRYGMVESLSIQRGIANTAFSQDRRFRGVEVSMSILDLSSQLYMPISEAFTKAAGGLAGKAVGLAAAGFSKANEAMASLVNISTTEAQETALKTYGALHQGMKFLGEIFTDDTNFTDYMSILASLGVADNVYPFRKLRLRALRRYAEWQTHYSIPALAMAYGDSFVMNFPRIFVRGNDNLFWK